MANKEAFLEKKQKLSQELSALQDELYKKRNEIDYLRDSWFKELMSESPYKNRPRVMVTYSTAWGGVEKSVECFISGASLNHNDELSYSFNQIKKDGTMSQRAAIGRWDGAKVTKIEILETSLNGQKENA